MDGQCCHLQRLVCVYLGFSQPQAQDLAATVELELRIDKFRNEDQMVLHTLIVVF